MLLLNAALSVEAGQAGSHQGQGWEPLTDAVLTAVAERADAGGVHAVGRPGQGAGGAHPGHRRAAGTWSSPPRIPARYRLIAASSGCRHFSQANAFLEANGRGAIDWSR